MKCTAVILFMFTGYCILQGQTKDTSSTTRSECLISINESDRLFQIGRYDQCIDILEEVLGNCSLQKGEKTLAMELLAKAYIETDNPGKAETIVNLMLKNFPHYELKDHENPEAYNRLVKKYKIHPRLSVGIRNTLDWMNYKTTRVIFVDGIHYDAPYVKELEGILNDFNWAYYGWLEYEFDNDISLNCDLSFKWTNFKREIETPEFNLIFREQDNYVEIPLCLKKYFHIGKYILPYVTAGMGWLNMTKSVGNATKEYPGGLPSVTSGDINMLSMRNTNTFEWIAGAGMGYKFKNLRLFLDVRYYGGLNSITNPQSGISDNTLYSEYLYFDNSVKLNQFEIGASISYTILNSVKRVRH